MAVTYSAYPKICKSTTMPVQQNMCHSSVPRNTMSVTVGMQEDHSFVKLELDVGNYIGVLFLM